MVRPGLSGAGSCGRGREIAFLLALGILVAIPTCAAETAPETAPPGGRFYSEFNGILRIWKPEAEMDFTPQEWPPMKIFETTRFPEMEPTPEQQRAADDLLARVTASAEQHGWYDFARASADGFEPMQTDHTHYVNRAFVTDGRTLDPDRPEFLLFYDSPEGKKLASFMFIVDAVGKEGPPIGGPLTVWHYHTWARPLCLFAGMVVMGPADEAGACPDGETPSRRSVEMLHVWLLDRPGGRFATDMEIEPFQMKHLHEGMH